MKQWEHKPGETPLDDISGLKIRHPHPTRGMVERFEAENIARAAEKYFARSVTARRAPFDLPWIKKLHKEMLGDVWAWAGEFRTTNLREGFADKAQIQMQLLQLLDDLKAWEMEPVEQAARLHHRAVQIHPFINGNGRWSRMLANIWLRLNGQPVIMWPVTVDKESPIREEYIAALKRADGMAYEPLIALHRQHQRP